MALLQVLQPLLSAALQLCITGEITRFTGMGLRQNLPEISSFDAETIGKPPGLSLGFSAFFPKFVPTKLIH